jgi:methyl-accepting chemotaxis protein
MRIDVYNLRLRTKVLCASAAVTLAVGLVLTLQSRRSIHNLAEEQLRAMGRDAGANFEAQAEQLVMLGNVAGLEAPLAQLRDNPAIAYAVVADAKQKILASTFPGEVPKEIADDLSKASGGSAGIRRELRGHGVLEIGIPLMQGALGDVRLGLNEDYVTGVVAKQTRLAMLALLVVLSLGLGLLTLVLDRVVRPILELSEVTRRIVDDGDLTQEVRATSNDEIGILAGRFSAMVGRLREIPMELDKNVQLLRQAVSVLETATSSQNAVVTRQASALQETQVTAEEIRQTSQVAARSAESILADIGKAEAAGEKGGAALEKSLESLADILHSVRGTSASIGELGERTRQIGGITNTVKDLADQSNMLALNAAIEAVRSGEHGKGFSLVAREIRRLADQSIQSTERVREILESVRMAVDTAIAGSEDGARQVGGSLEQMQSSSEHLRALANVVRDTSSAVRQIATAVSQQNAGVNQVFSAVVDQNKMMEESIKHLDGTLVAVDTLKEVSAGLADVIGRYKI